MPAAVQEHEAREEVGRQRQVVQDREDGQPVGGQPRQQRQDLHLVAQVEVHGRLVEDDEAPALGHGHGHQHELALAQRELADVTVAQLLDADAADGRVHRLAIRRALAREGMLVGDAPEPHDVLDAHREGQLDLAGHDRDEAGQPGALDAPERLAVERDRAQGRLDEPGQAAQEAGLAGAVGTDQADTFPGPDPQVDVGQDRPSPVGAG